MAVQAAVIAALLAFAAFAGAMALGVALIALYQWTAEEAGVYAGLGGRRPHCGGKHPRYRRRNQEQILPSD